jgi:2-dehydro-3-deoxyphosphogluconate aldolase / (4S)-4-hydroxy-2-oxoglutarate aldolase
MNLDIPAIGILRGVEANFFGELMQGSFNAGLQAIEITMNTKDAEKIINRYRASVPPGKLLGAGTVRNMEEARIAVENGAMFLVTPIVDLKIIEYAKKNSIPVIMGALTPTEVYSAWSAGADMIKVFPIHFFGPQYLKDLLGPFENLPLMAVGGITSETVNEYFTCGARAVGVSSSLFGREALKNKDLKKIIENVKKFVQALP